MPMKITVQRPPPGPFTRDSLTWDESNAAHIQARRFLDFVLGETNRNYPPMVFLVDEAWHDNAPGNSKSISGDSYSEKIRYRCAFESVHVAGGHQTCQCKFEYRKLRHDPNVVCISFTEFRHVISGGDNCHGRQDPGFMERDRYRYSPKLSHSIRAWIFSRLQAGFNATQILSEHRGNVLSRMHTEGIKYWTFKDDFLNYNEIRNVINSKKKKTFAKNRPEGSLLRSTSSLEQEAQASTMKEIPSSQAAVDLIPKTAGEPQSGEAVKMAQEDLNKRKREPSPLMR